MDCSSWFLGPFGQVWEDEVAMTPHFLQYLFWRQPNKVMDGYGPSIRKPSWTFSNRTNSKVFRVKSGLEYISR